LPIDQRKRMLTGSPDARCARARRRHSPAMGLRVAGACYA